MLTLPMLAAPPDAKAAVDMFLKISDVKGESKYTVAGTQDGQTVFKNARGELFRLGADGDFKFLTNKVLDKSSPQLNEAVDFFIKMEGKKGEEQFNVAGANDERKVYRSDQGQFFSVRKNGDLQLLDGAVSKFFRPNPKVDGTTEVIVVKLGDVKNENRYSVAGSSDGHPVYRSRQGDFFTLEDGSGDMKFLPVDTPIKSAEGAYHKHDLKNVLVGLRGGEPVWKNAKGEYFTVNKSIGDLQFFTAAYAKNKDWIDVSSFSWGVDAKGNTVYEKPNGEKFTLDKKTGDMVFAGGKDLIPFHTPGNDSGKNSAGTIDVLSWSWGVSQSGTLAWSWGETQSGTTNRGNPHLPTAGDPVFFEGKQGVLKLQNGSPAIDWGDGTTTSSGGTGAGKALTSFFDVFTEPTTGKGGQENGGGIAHEDTWDANKSLPAPSSNELPGKHNFIGVVTLLRGTAPNPKGDEASESVSVNFADIKYEYHEIGHEGAVFKVSATPDEQGNFSFSNLPEGDFTLSAPGQPGKPFTVAADGNFGGKVMKGSDGKMMIFDRWGNLIFEAAPKGTGSGPLKSTDGQNGTTHVGGGSGKVNVQDFHFTKSKENAGNSPQSNGGVAGVHTIEGTEAESDVFKGVKLPAPRAGDVKPTNKYADDFTQINTRLDALKAMPVSGSGQNEGDKASPVGGFGTGGPGTPGGGPAFGGMGNTPGPSMIPVPSMPSMGGPGGPGPMGAGPAGPGGLGPNAMGGRP